MINKDSSKVLNLEFTEGNEINPLMIINFKQKTDNLLNDKSFDSTKLTKLEARLDNTNKNSPKRKLIPVNDTLRYVEALIGSGPNTARNGNLSKVEVEQLLRHMNSTTLANRNFESILQNKTSMQGQRDFITDQRHSDLIKVSRITIGSSDKELDQKLLSSLCPQPDNFTNQYAYQPSNQKEDEKIYGLRVQLGKVFEKDIRVQRQQKDHFLRTPQEVSFTLGGKQTQTNYVYSPKQHKPILGISGQKSKINNKFSTFYEPVRTTNNTDQFANFRSIISDEQFTINKDISNMQQSSYNDSNIVNLDSHRTKLSQNNFLKNQDPLPKIKKIYVKQQSPVKITETSIELIESRLRQKEKVKSTQRYRPQENDPQLFPFTFPSRILNERPRLHGLLDHDTYQGNPPLVLKTLGKTRKSFKESQQNSVIDSIVQKYVNSKEKTTVAGGNPDIRLDDVLLLNNLQRNKYNQTANHQQSLTLAQNQDNISTGGSYATSKFPDKYRIDSKLDQFRQKTANINQKRQKYSASLSVNLGIDETASEVQMLPQTFSKQKHSILIKELEDIIQKDLQSTKPQSIADTFLLTEKSSFKHQNFTRKKQLLNVDDDQLKISKQQKIRLIDQMMKLKQSYEEPSYSLTNTYWHDDGKQQTGAATFKTANFCTPQVGSFVKIKSNNDSIISEATFFAGSKQTLSSKMAQIQEPDSGLISPQYRDKQFILLNKPGKKYKIKEQEKLPLEITAASRNIPAPGYSGENSPDQEYDTLSQNGKQTGLFKQNSQITSTQQELQISVMESTTADRVQDDKNRNELVLKKNTQINKLPEKYGDKFKIQITGEQFRRNNFQINKKIQSVTQENSKKIQSQILSISPKRQPQSNSKKLTINSGTMTTKLDGRNSSLKTHQQKNQQINNQNEFMVNSLYDSFNQQKEYKTNEQQFKNIYQQIEQKPDISINHILQCQKLIIEYERKIKKQKQELIQIQEKKQAKKEEQLRLIFEQKQLVNISYILAKKLNVHEMSQSIFDYNTYNSVSNNQENGLTDLKKRSQEGNDSVKTRLVTQTTSRFFEKNNPDLYQSFDGNKLYTESMNIQRDSHDRSYQIQENQNLKYLDKYTFSQNTFDKVLQRNSNLTHTFFKQENQIYAFYKDQFFQSILKEKNTVDQSLKETFESIQENKNQIQLLKKQNQDFQNKFKIYKKYITQFYSEWKDEYKEKVQKNQAFGDIFPNSPSFLFQVANPCQKMTSSSSERFQQILESDLDGNQLNLQDLDGTIIMFQNSPLLDGNPSGQDNKRSIIRKKDEFKIDSTLDTYDGRDLLQPTELNKKILLKTNESQPVNFSGEKVDLDMATKFIFSLKIANKQEKNLDLALSFLEVVRQFLNCDKVFLVPVDIQFQSNIISKKLNSKEKLQLVHELEFQDRTTGVKKQLSVISKSTKIYLEQFIVDSFHSCSEDIIIKGNKMAIIMRNDQEQPFFVIQAEYLNFALESKKQTVDKTGSRSTHTRMLSEPQSHNTTHQSMLTPAAKIKVSRTQGLFVKLLFSAIVVKFEKVLFRQQNKDSKHVFNDAIEMVQAVITQDTIKGVMRLMNKSVPKFMGFDHINCMFHDQEKDLLYTVAFGDEEERKQEMAKIIKQTNNEKEKAAILDRESVGDFMLSVNQMIIYPIHRGITSNVFNFQKGYYVNDFLPTSSFDFVSEVDNPKGYKDLKNFVIGPMKRENGSSNGIIQLFNSQIPILNHDLKKLEALGGFFGGCLEKAEDKAIKLKQVVSVLLNFEGARDTAEQSLDAIMSNGTIQSFINLQKPIDAMLIEIKKSDQDHQRWQVKEGLLHESQIRN